MPFPRVSSSLPPPARRRVAALGGIAILAAVFATYADALRAPFVFDDFPAIVRNPSIQHLWRAAVLNPPLTAAGAAGRPIVNLSLAIDHALSGGSPVAFHATNLVLHALTAWLLFLVLARTLEATGSASAARGPRGPSRGDGSAGVSPWAGHTIALGLSLLWAVHPLLSESVVCVIQRNEILVALFTLVTLYCLLRADASAHPARWLGAGVGASLLAAGSKEVAVVIPVVALLFDRTFLSGSFRAAWMKRRGFYLGLAATWIAVALLVGHNRERAGTVGFGLGVTSWQYALTQCRALATYVKLVFWPAPLVVDYGFPVVRHLADVWPLALLLVGALGVTVSGLARRKAAFLAAAFFLLLAPSSSFVPLTTQTIAEHRMYLPAAAVVIGAGLLACRLGRRLGGAVLLVAFVAFAGTTWLRVRDYRSETTLWTDTVAKAPENPRAHASLAGAYVKAHRWPEAIAEYRRALALQPDYADAHNDLGFALARSGDLRGAAEAYRRAVELKPDDPDLRYNLGNALARIGQPSAAAPQLQAALRIRPNFPAAAVALGESLLQLGQPLEAIGPLQAAVTQEPANAAARRTLALALLRAGRRDEALGEFREVVKLQPGSAPAHNDLGLALAETGEAAAALAEFMAALQLQPDFPGAQINAANACLALGDAVAAVDHLRAAVRKLPQNPELHYNLGALLAQLHRPSEARAELEAALKLSPDLTPAREALERLPTQ